MEGSKAEARSSGRELVGDGIGARLDQITTQLWGWQKRVQPWAAELSTEGSGWQTDAASQCAMQSAAMKIYSARECLTRRTSGGRRHTSADEVKSGLSHRHAASAAAFRSLRQSANSFMRAVARSIPPPRIFPVVQSTVLAAVAVYRLETISSSVPCLAATSRYSGSPISIHTLCPKCCIVASASSAHAAGGAYRLCCFC